MAAGQVAQGEEMTFPQSPSERGSAQTGGLRQVFSCLSSARSLWLPGPEEGWRPKDEPRPGLSENSEVRTSVQKAEGRIRCERGARILSCWAPARPHCLPEDRLHSVMRLLGWEVFCEPSLWDRGWKGWGRAQPI